MAISIFRRSFRPTVLLLNLLVLILIVFYKPFPEGINQGMALLIFVAVLWFSEAMHITITALTVPILAVLLGVFETKQALANFAHPVIFLFLGGFALASALRSQGLDKALAQLIVRASGGRPWLAILLMLCSVSFLSMWISNTATTAMMLPMMIGLLDAIAIDKYRDNNARFALLGLAYCASLGGMATIVGSPPNAIAAAQLNLSFIDWMQLAFPLLLVLFPTCLFMLWLMTRPRFPKRVSVVDEPFVWTTKRVLTSAVFLITVLAWMLSRPLSGLLGDLNNIDTLIALTSLVTLALLRLLDWKAFQQQTDWGVLLLFGGGLTLSAALKTTGTSIYLADVVAGLFSNTPLLLTFIGLAAFVVFLTEVASNTASAALLVPLFASLAVQLYVPEQALVVMVGLACSCAFMLPVATPPNAIVYGSGELKLSDFLRHGIVLNIICSVLLAIYALLFIA
ncbi:MULTISPECIES: SLC13 family permease [Corallincola]|uniref:SLC13/DASS family transporter n=2 Tax=Corallincola TaxID=1775176 RepID=A0ABY1WU91_9GAMM|nr:MULTISPECIES: SLC13 family permease [Corallincola]TAA48318.1 SLC13/DASS family transporter [Corallincola spongiicola]TCI02377.1 SLC13/DASS family transporter [Corallincola luteus]